MCAVVNTVAPVAEAAPPNHPDTSKVETRQFTAVTADLEAVLIPPNTAAVTVVAQGGQGAGGGSFTAGGGSGGVGGVVFAMSVPVGAGAAADSRVGDTLIVQVGGQAGNQPSGDCRGGNGGGGDGTGKGGGQGGQCSYVKNQRTGEYLAIAGGGGGGGGASGGSVGGGFGGGGGERLNENGNFDASGWPGGQPGGGGSGGSPNRCTSLTPSNGGNGGNAGTASFAGGGGGGGGGCAGGGGGSVSGGGGAGGGSVEIVGRPYHFAPGSPGNGYVTVYFLKGKDNTISPEGDEGQVSTARTGVTRIPNNAITMQYIATGGAGGGQGGRGATVFGNVPINPTGSVRPGDLVIVKAGNSTAGDLNGCNGGRGGLENGGGRGGLDGGGCSAMRTSGIGGAPFIFAAGGGGGNGTPNSNGGGDAGQPGGGGAFGAIGGSGGPSCTVGDNIAQEISASGGDGANGGTDGVFNYGGGGGGGGGCRAGGGGGRVSGTGIDGGGGGGGGSYVDGVGNGSIFRGPLVSGGGHLAAGNVHYFFTLADKPVFTSGNSTTFTQGSAGSFSVTTSANPTATVVHESGGLPSGVNFTPGVVGSGGGTISGTPQPGTGGVYNIVLKASNVAGDTTQNFTLTVNAPPSFTSASGTTFTKGTSGSFNVTTSGHPAATVSLNPGSSFPSGVTLTPGANGTATLNYNGAGDGGQYTFTLKATNGISPDALQTFVVTINEAPSITSAPSHTCQVGQPCNFTVTADGFPLPGISESPTGTLAAKGLTYTNNFNGTGTISGTPTSGGVVNVRWVAINGVGSNATQDFTLTINGAPVFTSANTATFASGTNQSFLVTTSSCCNDTVTISRTGDGLPAGVTFVDNGNKTATFSGNPVGTAGGVYTYTLTATNAFGSTTQTFTLRVHTPSIFTSPNTTTFFVNQPNSFTITTADGFPVPTLAPTVAYSAPLSFLDNGNGTATVSGTPTTEGPVVRTIQAANAHSTTSQILTISVTKAATTTGLAASPVSPSTRFQSVTFTATVADATSSPGSPTGNVVFSIDGTPQAPSAVDPVTGRAILTTANLSVGPHTIGARYLGDTRFLASVSSDLAHQVNQASTSTGVVTSLSPSRLGDNVTFTATVTDTTTGTPTGAVQFKDGLVDIGSPVAINGSGQASITRNNLAIGGHTIFAVYSGDVDFAGSQGSVSQQVNKALSTTVLASAPNPSTPGQAVTFTATVTGNPVALTPTGTVQFKNGATNLGSPVPLNGSGVAQLPTSVLTGGTHSITAVYSGSTLYEASTGGPLSHTVTCTTTLTGRITTVVTLSGSVCVRDATLTNTVKLGSGAKVSILNSQISGSLTTPNGGPAGLVICGSSLNVLVVSQATGPLVVGNPSQGCAANSTTGDVRMKGNKAPLSFFRNGVGGDATFSNNTGGLTIGGNTFNQDLTCNSNNPAPTNGGLLNTVVSVRNGQCRGAF